MKLWPAVQVEAEQAQRTVAGLEQQLNRQRLELQALEDRRRAVQADYNNQARHSIPSLHSSLRTHLSPVSTAVQSPACGRAAIGMPAKYLHMAAVDVIAHIFAFSSGH